MVVVVVVVVVGGGGAEVGEHFLAAFGLSVAQVAVVAVGVLEAVVELVSHFVVLPLGEQPFSTHSDPGLAVALLGPQAAAAELQLSFL